MAITFISIGLFIVFLAVIYLVWSLDAAWREIERLEKRVKALE